MKRQPIDLRDYEGWTEENFAEDLRTNERYQAFFQKYKPDGIENFIRQYAGEKFQLHERKAILYSNADFRRSEFLKEAERFLNIILQKKLFNLQCLWRANLIELPLVEFTKDFDYFGSHIADCPFIEPITEEELEVGIRFLLEEDDETDPYFDDWQNYEGFKVWDDDDDDDDDVANLKTVYYARGEIIPDFYLYYDKCLKTSHLFNLPDVRWEKEKYYFDAIREMNRRKNALESKEETVYEPYFPSLSYFSGHTEFVESFEDRTTQELFAIESEGKTYKFREEIDDDIDFLIKLRRQGEEIALVPHTDWLAGIQQTVIAVTKRKTAEMLPYAYQTYMLAFEDEDWEAVKAHRLGRFKYDLECYSNSHRERWHETMAEGKALRDEETPS